MPKILHMGFYTQRHLHKSFSYRCVYAQKLLNTDASTHRSIYTEKLLRTGAFTHRRLYTQKLVHTEASTHRSFYTQKPLHTATFPQRDHFHREAFTRFKIAILPKFLKPTTIISRKMVVRDVSKWIKPQLHQFLNVCVWRLKIATFLKLLPLDFHVVLASELWKSQISHQLLTFDPHFVRTGGAAPQKI